MTARPEDIPEQYEKHAQRWDLERPKALFEQTWLDRFLAATKAGTSLLELGPGAGEPITKYMIEQGYHVTGIDTSASMIAICQKRFPDHDWHIGNMCALDFELIFDGILAWDSFFHLKHSDQRAMFPLFSAHAKTGTTLMFTSGHEYGEAIGTLCGEPLYHASLDTAEYQELLNDNNFRVIDHIVEDKNCYGHTIWLAEYL